jgi:hypothetical protein
MIGEVNSRRFNSSIVASGASLSSSLVFHFRLSAYVTPARLCNNTEARNTTCTHPKFIIGVSTYL